MITDNSIIESMGAQIKERVGTKFVKHLNEKVVEALEIALEETDMEMYAHDVCLETTMESCKTELNELVSAIMCTIEESDLAAIQIENSGS
ncbi:MAG: hypothetical protein HRT71_17075 [Flavobacteriales bacterium]|nr:hypothetical protein [Flavobacteriales bacterium]